MKFIEYWGVFDELLETSLKEDFKDRIDYTELFKRLITSGEEEKIDWPFNKFENFESIINKKLESIDSYESRNLFQKEQENIFLNLIYEGGSYQTIQFNDRFFEFIDPEIVDDVKRQQYKKLQYLKQKLDRMDAEANDPNNFIVDDPKFESVAKKIIALHRLGILDHLDSVNELITSTNAKAKVIALLTGDNVTTIQSALNAMVKDNVSKNNPLKSAKSRAEVEEILNKIGAKIIKD